MLPKIWRKQVFFFCVDSLRADPWWRHHHKNENIGTLSTDNKDTKTETPLDTTKWYYHQNATTKPKNMEWKVVTHAMIRHERVTFIIQLLWIGVKNRTYFIFHRNNLLNCKRENF